MSEMVERVARAICRAGICGPKDHLDVQEELHWRRFTLEARAAIEAMREPTSAMIVQGCDGGTGEHIRAWQAMIDEALK